MNIHTDDTNCNMQTMNVASTLCMDNWISNRFCTGVQHEVQQAIIDVQISEL